MFQTITNRLLGTHRRIHARLLFSIYVCYMCVCMHVNFDIYIEDKDDGKE